jgi:hypothetical protein
LTEGIEITGDKQTKAPQTSGQEKPLRFLTSAGLRA